MVVELKQLNLTDGMEVELRTISGLTNKGTMKLKGEIKREEVVVLIDSGATHNFILLKIVEEEKIPLEEGTQFGVTIGNGTRCRGREVCRRLLLELKGLTIVADFLATELGNVDVILEMQWTGTTGTMKVHWPSLTMMFCIGTKQISLKGDPSLVRLECSLRTIEKTWDKEDQGFLLESQNYDIEMNEDLEEEQEIKGDEEDTPMIRFLLHQYSDIFENLKGLPPRRELRTRSLNHGDARTETD